MVTGNHSPLHSHKQWPVCPQTSHLLFSSVWRKVWKTALIINHFSSKGGWHQVAKQTNKLTATTTISKNNKKLNRQVSDNLRSSPTLNIMAVFNNPLTGFKTNSPEFNRRIHHMDLKLTVAYYYETAAHAGLIPLSKTAKRQMGHLCKSLYGASVTPATVGHKAADVSVSISWSKCALDSQCKWSTM